MRWHDNTVASYAEKFHIDKFHLHEWVSVRFIGELTERIQRLLSYPFIIAFLFVLARSRYFDSWKMPLWMDVSIILVFASILSCDLWLNYVAADAMRNATKFMRRSVIKCKSANPPGGYDADLAEQLEKLIKMVEDFDLGSFKPFPKRQIFPYLLLIILALVLGSTDSLVMIQKFFE